MTAATLTRGDTLTADQKKALEAWRKKLREAYREELIAEGFTEDELIDIALDAAFDGLFGVLENVWRLYRALRAYEKAKAKVGPPPVWLDSGLDVPEGNGNGNGSILVALDQPLQRLAASAARSPVVADALELDASSAFELFGVSDVAVAGTPLEAAFRSRPAVTAQVLALSQTTIDALEWIARLILEWEEEAEDYLPQIIVDALRELKVAGIVDAAMKRLRTGNAQWDARLRRRLSRIARLRLRLRQLRKHAKGNAAAQKALDDAQDSLDRALRDVGEESDHAKAGDGAAAGSDEQAADKATDAAEKSLIDAATALGR
jgi:hypothetical protein